MIAAESASGTLASRAAQLFAQFRDGDEATMSDLVTLVTPILWHTARAQRLDHDSAQDVVQTVWLALVRSAASISDPQAVLQWLIVSTRREAWRVVRRTDRVEPRDLEPDDFVTSRPKHSSSRRIPMVASGNTSRNSPSAAVHCYVSSRSPIDPTTPRLPSLSACRSAALGRRVVAASRSCGNHSSPIPVGARRDHT